MNFFRRLFAPNVAHLKRRKDFGGLFRALHHESTREQAAQALDEALGSAPWELLVQSLDGGDTACRRSVAGYVDRKTDLRGLLETLSTPSNDIKGTDLVTWAAAASVQVEVIAARARAASRDNEDSNRFIEILIAALENHLVSGDDALYDLGDADLRTRSNLVRTLQTITGETLGDDVEAWKQWHTLTIRQEVRSRKTEAATFPTRADVEGTMDYQWMKDEGGKVCAIWLREEETARNPSLLQQLIYSKFGLASGLSLVAQLGSAKVRRNTVDPRGGWFVFFESPIDAPD